jgi:hypothetical protein
MREQMQALQTAKDPAERRKLLAEDRQAMHDMMSMLQGMMEARPTAPPGGAMMGMMGGRQGGMMGMMGGQRPGMLGMEGASQAA